jgi:actin-related protein 4
VIPSYYGVIEQGGSKKHFIGDNDVHAIRPKMEVKNPMSDGIGMG